MTIIVYFNQWAEQNENSGSKAAILMNALSALN